MSLLGPQWPPFALVPDSYSTAAADELADFAVQVLHQPPDEWQHNTLRIGCGERRDGTWAAAEVLLGAQRQNGKGVIPEARGLGGLFLLGEQELIYTAHVSDTVQKCFQRCIDLVEGSDELIRRVKRINRTHGQEAIEHVNGGTFAFRTRGIRPGKGRGLTCDCLFLDEALYLAQELLDGLLPTMLARPNPQIWYLSTPPETSDAPLMRIRDEALAGAPNMAMALWCNPPEADLEDEATLASANPAWGIRLNTAMMAVLRRRLGEAGFARECGGIWPVVGQEAQWKLLIEAFWIDAKVDHRRPSSQMRSPVAYGVSVAPDRSWSAIAAGGRMAGGGRLIEVTARDGVADYRPGTAWLISRMTELEEHRPCVVVIDDKAIAEQAEAAGLVVHRALPADQAAAAATLYDGLSGDDPVGRDVHQLDQPHLRVAAAAVRRRRSGAAWYLESSSTVDIAPIKAASLALWGHATPRVHRRVRVGSVAVVGARERSARPVESVEQARMREQIERDLARSAG